MASFQNLFRRQGHRFTGLIDDPGAVQARGWRLLRLNPEDVVPLQNGFNPSGAINSDTDETEADLAFTCLPIFTSTDTRSSSRSSSR